MCCSPDSSVSETSSFTSLRHGRHFRLRRQVCVAGALHINEQRGTGGKGGAKNNEPQKKSKQEHGLPIPAVSDTHIQIGICSLDSHRVSFGILHS